MRELIHRTKKDNYRNIMRVVTKDLKILLLDFSSSSSSSYASVRFSCPDSFLLVTVESIPETYLGLIDSG